MKVLRLHVDEVEYEVVKKECKLAVEVSEEEKKKRLKDALVAFVSVESGDDKTLAKKAIDETKSFMEKLKVRELLLYPFSHLSNNLAKPFDALEILNFMKAYAEELGMSVHLAPFGWNKRFALSLKPHPLAESFRSYEKGKGEEVAKKEEEEGKREFYLLTQDGKLLPIEDVKLEELPEELRILVEREALKKGATESHEEPEYIKHVKKFGFEWESMSDLGHMRYGPKACLIIKLISSYVSELVRSLGIPVYEIRGTNMFRLDEKAIAEHAKLFGERMYRFESDGKDIILRYAACFQQFAAIKDWQISYRHLPFGAFEIADSYRYEQSGELLLCFRLRKMLMPDFHVFCKDIEEAKGYFLKLHELVYEEIRKLGREYVSLYNLTSKEFLEKNEEFFSELLRVEKKPVLVCVYPPGKNFYWVLNIEYHIIDKMKRPREIATVQIDVGNSERFGIRYADKDGKEKHPIILHTAVLGTIERWVYTLFDTALREKNPTLPLWLSPTQVRIIPVSEKFLEFAKQILASLEKEGIRVDLDDRNETVGKKIRDAEQEWVPYVLVVGEKELERKGETIPVRVRKEGKVEEMRLRELVRRVKEEAEGFPSEELPYPKFLSRRVNF